MTRIAIRVQSSPRECGLDTHEELDVVKAILLREEYIGRVKANFDSHGSKFGKDQRAFDDLLSLLDLLRSATVDTVEAIQQWRRTQGYPKPFIWRGANYLLKIPIDLDFLDRHKVKFHQSCDTSVIQHKAR